MRYVFALDKETVYGQIMLNILLEKGLTPKIVLEEDSSSAEYHRKLWLDRTEGKNLAPSIAYQVEKHKLRYVEVENLCNNVSEEIIKRESPDLIVLGGTRSLVTENIFSIPPWGTLISHPGLLPHIRGASGTAWSIYNDIQVAASCIIIDGEYDTGPILRIKIVPVYEGDTYEEICESHIFACGELMAEVLLMFKEKNGPIEGSKQDPTVGKTYKTMPPKLVAEVKAKLANRSYRWIQKRC